MISIAIDGKTIEVEEGTFLLDAARGAEIPIPTLCHHKALTSDGNCRLCLTEIKVGGKTKMVTACNYPIREEIEASTTSKKVMEYRKDLLPMMLARWPNVPILKTYARQYGATEPSYKHPDRNEAEDACILCSRCTRACSEI
ncbi:MAG: (2Fe-2S)-binding protein, partial [Phycisphaerae bacterium]|nr:(2Fe-2S)-binding protein [Phycisphaerae bacterium]